MKIISTNIGQKQTVNWKGKDVVTGIFKYATSSPIFLNVEEVKGDVICDRRYHGGIDKAVYAYSFKHYAYFKELYPNLDWQYGMFGENLTIDDLDEETIFSGDVFKVGEAIVEVTKPREPCMKLGIRFNDMKIVKQFWNTTKSGVYFKVLQTGNVKVGDEFKKIKSGLDNQTIAAMYNQKKLRR